MKQRCKVDNVRIEHSGQFVQITFADARTGVCAGTVMLPVDVEVENIGKAGCVISFGKQITMIFE